VASGDEAGVGRPALVAGKPLELPQDILVVPPGFRGEMGSLDELVNEVLKGRFGFGCVHLSLLSVRLFKLSLK